MSRELVFATLKNEKAIMRLDKRIGPNPNEPNEPFINGSYFADEMDYLYKQGKKIQVRINSIGGNVLHGWTIYDAISTCQADTHCYGLAASMAGICLLAGVKRTCDAHATSMLHGPHLEDGSTATSPWMEEVRNSFAELLKNRTKMTDEMIEKIVTKGDHYFDASDMYELGIVTKEPIASKIKPPKKINASAKELYEVYASLEKPKNDMSLEKELLPKWLTAVFKGKDENDTMSKALEANGKIVALENEKTQLTAEVTTLKGRVAALESEISASKKDSIGAQAKELVEKAVKDKKLILTEDQAKNLIATASVSKESFESIKLMIDGNIGEKKVSVAAGLKDTPGGNATPMGYEEMAQKHPEALAKLAEEQPELFAKMQDDYLADVAQKRTKK